LPAITQIKLAFALEVPKDRGIEDEITIRDERTGRVFEARINEITPIFSTALQMRMRVAVEGITAEAIDQLTKVALAIMKERGFR
jgi:hypothetical protein